ncbi:MAG: hypothetical protein MJD61_21945 [Proteobacteria bacterium]|nr:hypothetical protein [Pseudomonadota bacterium]
MKSCDRTVVEAAGLAGFDFVILDMERGPASLETVMWLAEFPCRNGAAGRRWWA